MLKISIIIPVYNVSLFIERCLLSVVEQRHEALEVILVDDASPDDSMEKARRFLSGYPKLDYKIVTHPQNKGLSAARNTGVKHSTGAYLYFLDSDDALPENAIAILADKAIADRPDFVMGDMRILSFWKGGGATAALWIGPGVGETALVLLLRWVVETVRQRLALPGEKSVP